MKEVTVFVKPRNVEACKNGMVCEGDEVLVKQAYGKMIRRMGVTESKKKVNSILDGWETKPISSILDQLQAEAVPFIVNVRFGRAIKESSIKLIRRLFGEAVREAAKELTTPQPRVK